MICARQDCDNPFIPRGKGEKIKRYCSEQCRASAYNKDYRNERKTYFRNAQKAHYARRRQAVTEAKDRPCVDCGKRYPFYVMDFDHVPERGEKLFSIGSAVASKTYADILAEISKCDVLCANCHRERTYQRRHHDKEKCF